MKFAAAARTATLAKATSNRAEMLHGEIVRAASHWRRARIKRR
jgi:hypothetical protein